MTSTTNEPAAPERSDASTPAANEEIKPLEDIADYLRAYARQKPETVALVCIGIGFVLGWRLKPW